MNVNDLIKTKRLHFTGFSTVYLEDLFQTCFLHNTCNPMFVAQKSENRKQIAFKSVEFVAREIYRSYQQPKGLAPGVFLGSWRIALSVL